MQSLNDTQTERLGVAEQERESLSVRLAQVEHRERTASEGAREKVRLFLAQGRKRVCSHSAGHLP